MFLSHSQKQCLDQLAKDKGHTTCHDCGSQNVGVNGYESDWELDGSFQVVLECFDCGAGDYFSASPEEAKNCGLDPDVNLPGTPETDG